MKIGLVGLTNSGKTTIFNALSGLHAEVTPYPTTKTEPNLSVVEVKDARVTKLSEMYQPQKTIYATLELADFAGAAENAGKESTETMALIRSMDALAHVVRNFEDDLMGETRALEDIQKLNDELIITDLIVAEKRLEKIILSYKRGQKTPVLQMEEKAINKVIEQLNNNLPIRDLLLENEEEKALRGFRFLTQKPLMIILNSAEENFQKQQELLAEINKIHQVIEFAGKFEMELAGLNPEEAAAFMEDMGILSSAKDRLTAFAYNLLGYISFFTVGKDEVRAWTIKNNETAVEAAGTIHSDLARGFIRAETFAYHDLIELGSEKALREKGLFRLEGKTYLVQDGDILNIRFSV